MKLNARKMSLYNKRAGKKENIFVHIPICLSLSELAHFYYN